MLACRHNNPEYVDFLVKMGSSIKAVDYKGWTAIHYAARFNAHLVVTHLIEEYGLVPDELGFLGKSAAHLAAMADHLEAFKALFLAEGGCEMGPDHSGFTPIDEAQRNGSAKIIRYLYRLGMGAGRAVPEEVERKALEGMKEIWEKSLGWNVCQEWVEGVPDGIPRRINLRKEWEAEQFPEEQAKRRRLE